MLSFFEEMSKVRKYLYLLDLKRQFDSSIDNRVVGDGSLEYEKEFEEWKRLLEINTAKYGRFLEEKLGICLNDRGTVEVGKGRYASVSGIRTTVVSRYGDTLGKDMGDFMLYKDSPIVIINGVIREEKFNNFLTHNPYNYRSLMVMDKVSKDQGVYVGVYGNSYDKDRSKKIIGLRSNLGSDYFTYEWEDKDSYFYIMHTNKEASKGPKAKKRSLFVRK